MVTSMCATSALRAECGAALVVSPGRWTGGVSSCDRSALAHTLSPVLDVGCGPGRHAEALSAEGVPVLGIDVTPAAVTRARQRGVAVMLRSVFHRVPGAGRWGSALLLDGNIGIGGDPVALLERVASLVRPGGRLVVETRAAGHPGPETAHVGVRLELDGALGPPFDWTVVGVDELPFLASRAGLRLGERWTDGGRWFGVLHRG